MEIVTLESIQFSISFVLKHIPAPIDLTEKILSSQPKMKQTVKRDIKRLFR